MTRPPVERLVEGLTEVSTVLGRHPTAVPVTFTVHLPTVDGEPTTHVLEYRGTEANPRYLGVGAAQVNLACDVDGWDHGEFTPLVTVLDELLTTWLEGVDLDDEPQFFQLESRVLDWLQAQADTLIDRGQRAFQDRLGYERTELRPVQHPTKESGDGGA